MEETQTVINDDENEVSNRSPLRLILALLIVVLLPLALGLFYAPRLVPKPKIGIVRLSNEINGLTAFVIEKQLNYAREHGDVKAVLFIMNSPGGSAAYSEELFLEMWNLRQTMPVVATVDLLAASGAYYMAAAADEIYAKPTSTIGSIGVIAFVPKENLVIQEELITTGPYKSFGGTRDGFMRQMEVSKFSFLDAVATGRAGKLNVSTEFLSRAEVWNGSQALEYGLIDGLMATNEVMDRTAELAGLSRYETVELFDAAFPEFADDTLFNQPAPVDIDSLWQLPADMPAGLYYRYIQSPNK